MKNPLFWIIALTLGLRIVTLNQSFWLDEAIGAIAARDYSYSEIVTRFIYFDNHPPLYYLLLKFWASIFGYSEIALRSLSVFFGALMVFILYKINKTASLLLATSQIHIYYSQEARMYVMAGFFAILAVYFFLKALKNKKNTGWLIFSLALVGMMATDYMPMFLLPVFPLYVFLRKRKAFSKLVASFVPLVIFGVLWLPVISTQIGNYREVSSSFLFGGATFKQAVLFWIKFAFGRISFEPKIIYYALVGLASLPIITSLFISFRKRNLLIWLWLSVPVILGFLASFLFPAFSYFRFVYILPAFYILIARANKKFLVYLVILFNFLGLVIYYADPHQQREQWRQAVKFIESEPEPESIALFEFSAPFAPYLWYSQDKLEARGATDAISAGPKTKNLTRKLIEDKSRIYYFDYLRDVSDPERFVEKVITEEGFKEISKTTEFVGIGAITTYEKVKQI